MINPQLYEWTYVADIRSVAGVRSQQALEQLVVGAALLEYTQLGKGSGHVQLDQFHTRFPARRVL